MFLLIWLLNCLHTESVSALFVANRQIHGVLAQSESTQKAYP